MSAHQHRVDSFVPGWITRDTINANARSRIRPNGPNTAARPTARARAVTAATCPCGNERSALLAVAAEFLSSMTLDKDDDEPKDCDSGNVSRQGD